MAISINNYIQIGSIVGGASPIPTKDLILRLFSDNALIPPQSYLVFSSAADVLAYFGSSSDEYLRAAYYFSFVSKLGTVPQLLSFARWVDVAQAPQIFGRMLTSSLTSFTAITTGSFALTLGAITHNLTALDFSAAGSFAAIATILQTAIRAADMNAQWTGATVTFNSESGGFNLVGGTATTAAISVGPAGTGVDIRALLGWLPGLQYPRGPVFSPGSTVETITQALTTSDRLSDNFGTFAFMLSLTQDQIDEAAAWNAGLNVKYGYLAPVSAENATDIANSLLMVGGTALTLAPLDTEYPEQFPASVFAATDYTAPNSVANYEFQQSTLTPSVTDDADYAAYVALGVNFYGQTQTAGQNISFYQQGVMTGSGEVSNIIDMGVYFNEIWLRSYATASLMNMFLGLNKVSADPQGAAQIRQALQPVIDLALLNGTISVGSALTAEEIAFIITTSKDPRAFYQVRNRGYWLGVVINPNTLIATYTLIYKKNDVIRKIIGEHDLI